MDAFVIRTRKSSPTSSQERPNNSKVTDCRGRESSSETDWISKSSSKYNQLSHTSSTSEVGALNKIKPDRGQRKISDLGGVVVLEKIQKYVQKLKDPNIPSVAKIDILRRLQKKSPSTNIIKSSGIGKIVSRLANGSTSMIGTSSKDLEVQKQLLKEAKLLKHKWTEVIERRVELQEKGSTLDVQVDALTASFRKKAVNLLLEASNTEINFTEQEKNISLSSTSKLPETDSNSQNLIVVELIEKYLFFSNHKRTSNTYRKSVRKLTFDLKSNKHNLRKILIKKSFNSYKSISKVVKEHLTNNSH